MFNPAELRDSHGKWSVADKGKSIIDALHGSSRERPLIQRDINARIKGAHEGGMGPFSDQLEAGRLVAAMQKQGLIKVKWIPDRKAHGYYLPNNTRTATPGPTKSLARTPTKAPTKAPAEAVAKSAPALAPAIAHQRFDIVGLVGRTGDETIIGHNVDHAAQQRFGDNTEIRNTGAGKFIFKNGQPIARVKAPNEPQYRGAAAYLNGR